MVCSEWRGDCQLESSRHAPDAGVEYHAAAWLPDQDTAPLPRHFVCCADLDAYVHNNARWGLRGGHLWCPGKAMLRTQAQADAALQVAVGRAKAARVAVPRASDFGVGKSVDCCYVSEPLDAAAASLARALSAPAFQALRLAKELWTESEIEEAKEEKEKERLARELVEWQRLVEEERQLGALAKQVRENMLDCRCPKCGHGFQNLRGSFDLKYSSCKTAFCGWCLVDCDALGADARPEVNDFFCVLRLRRATLLLRFLSKLDGDELGASWERTQTQPQTQAQTLVRHLLKDLLDMRLVEVLRAYPDFVTADKSRLSPQERRRLERWEHEAQELLEDGMVGFFPRQRRQHQAQELARLRRAHRLRRAEID